MFWMQWKLQIKFLSLDPQMQTSHPVECYSYDGLTWAWKVIMLTVDSGGGGLEEQKQQTKRLQKRQLHGGEGKLFFLTANRSF